MALATFRLSHFLVEEDGPFDVVLRLREATGIVYNMHGQIVSYPNWNFLHCVWCTSLWMAPVIMLLWVVSPIVLYVMALSAVAGFLNGQSKH